MVRDLLKLEAVLVRDKLKQVEFVKKCQKQVKVVHYLFELETSDLYGNLDLG